MYERTNVIQGGLVLHLDASIFNTVAYGTTWFDLSGNGNNGAITNGPAYSSSNGGSLTFDGVNDYVDFTAPNLTTTTTIEMWAKLGSGYADKMVFGWNFYDVWCASGHLGYNTGNGDVYGINSTQVSNLGLVNNWKHYIFEMRSDVVYTNNKIYINSTQQSLGQVGGNEAPSNRNFNSGNGRISGWRASSDYVIPMECSSFKVYNRALSAAEVAHNYNVTKGRFGL
jgi:hypothetical protein